MWHGALQDAWHQGKRTVGHMWNQAVKIAGDVDRAFTVGKRVFGALHPMLEDFGGSQVSRAVMQGVGHYEKGRNQILGYHNNVEATLSRLRRAAPELRLD
jgi:hypothetical protein